MLVGLQRAVLGRARAIETLPLQKYGPAIAVSSAGLLVFWLSGELLMTAEASVYSRLALPVATAVACGVLIQHRGFALDDRRYSSREIVQSITGLAWAADPEVRLTAVSTVCREYLGVADLLQQGDPS